MSSTPRVLVVDDSRVMRQVIATDAVSPLLSGVRGWLLCLVSCAALACGGRPATARAPEPVHGSPASAPPAASAAGPGRAASELQKTFTGQARPSLVVENGFPIAQHVFIDWVERATLAPAASQRFELDPGTHTVTCADSPNPDDHPAAVSEGFDVGYQYVYALRPGP